MTTPNKRAIGYDCIAIGASSVCTEHPYAENPEWQKLLMENTVVLSDINKRKSLLWWRNK